MMRLSPNTMIAMSMITMMGLTTRADSLENSIVELRITRQAYNSHQPWQKQRPETRNGYGAVIGPGQILTTEELVRSHTLVQFTKPRSGRKVTAHVEFADPQINLALLTVDPNDVDVHLAPLEIADTFSDDAAIEIVQIDETKEIQRGDAEIVRILVENLPSADFSTLSFHVLTDLSIERSSALALLDGKLAGLILSYDSDERIGHMLPSHVVRRFLDDTTEPPYQGFAMAGFAWSPLVDPVKRRYLNVTNNAQGIIVKSVLPGTGADAVIRPNDVILEWDGRLVTEMGYYDDDEFGRLRFPYLIKGHRRPGENVPVHLVRDGTATTVNVTLSRYRDEDAYVPRNTTGDRPSYVVEGGFVIRELDAQYLHAYGSEWRTRVDSRLVHINNMQALTPPEPGDKVVILASVLSDPINVGYQHFFNQIIETVNGNEIRNIDDVFEILFKDGHLVRLTLRSNGLNIVLDADKTKDANTRIAATYRIGESRYKATRRQQEK